MSNQLAAVERFRALHAAACFVMPNPWDAGSAVLLEHAGFHALGTTSAGFAFSRGLPDAIGALWLDEVLAHCRDLAAATSLPVHADFQEGYADDPEGVAANVTACIATGVAGLSIEDASGDPEAPLHDRATALARLRAARGAIDASGVPVILTARCESYLVGTPEPDKVALDRLVAYAEAGADCVFAPGVRDPDTIATMVRAVAPVPLNVVVSSSTNGLSVARLADLGVRRISLGSALARVALGAFLRAARVMLETGSFLGLEGAASFQELDDVFASRRR